MDILGGEVEGIHGECLRCSRIGEVDEVCPRKWKIYEDEE